MVLIGDFSSPPDLFEGIHIVFDEFNTKAFHSLSRRKQFKRINQILLELIQRAPKQVFLLGAIVDYIQKINDLKLFSIPYTITLFEFWLNHFSEVTTEEQYEIRAKIMGKSLPRDAYQAYFPIGNGLTFSGTHFVVAHLSPDIDTTIASFWGWVDAFSARVGSGQHTWCLPGGPPSSPLTPIYHDLFGKGIFTCTARTALTLTLTAQDLVTKKNLSKEDGSVSISTIDHGINEKAVILVDEQGHYKGDWRSSDIEPVRQVIVLFKSCLHWFENNLHIKLISLFASPQLHVDQVQQFIASACDIKLDQCEPVQEFNDKQKEDLNQFLIKVLGIPQGLNGSFRDLSEAMNAFEVYELGLFIQELQNLFYSNLFDVQGTLVENRTTILNQIERIIIQLDIAIHCIRNYVECLDVSVLVKERVTAPGPEQYITLNSEVDEIRLKMKSYNYLTVLIPEEGNNTFPVGVVWGDTLRKSVLGTASLRDFSSMDEVRMAPYLSVISVIDHHRSSLATSSTPLAMISDAQSTSVHLGEIACALNDRYSLGGMTLEQVQAQLKELSEAPQTSQNIRLQRRLLKKISVAQTQSSSYIHPKREFAEYLTFLIGICDDSDLLNKVTTRDIMCVVNLLNRMKSLIEKKVIEVIDLDDIPRNAQFAKQAAKRILKSPDMHSIYKKIFSYKEEEIEKQIKLCGEGKPHELFADTKEQNKCCRVGQIKLFSSNIPAFEKNRQKIMEQWLQNSYDVVQTHPEIDFHLFMISTIPSTDEVYEDRVGRYVHQDELWFWGPHQREALAHLSSFLLAFQSAVELQNNHLYLEILSGDNAQPEIEEIFRRHFLPVRLSLVKTSQRIKPWAILRYDAGSINSRKATITPYLPRTL